MKELFCGFLNVSISGSLVICVILLLRLLLRRGSRSLTCAFWLVAFVRLLLPFKIGTPWSLMPSMPSVSGSETQLFGKTEVAMSGTIPAFIPQAVVTNSGNEVVVDYVAILGIIWGIGAIAMLLYMLISYIALRLKVRTAVQAEKGVYVVEGLQSAMLLGYLVPRVYLPSGMEQHSVELVIAHELMHKKRGDNWLKLLGFVCLAMHWFNPLVWVAYLLMCRDVEDACDEQVVKNLGAEEKKAYCTALLACGKEKKQKVACPVAFGEISLGQRIKNVLSGKKPAVWISVAAVVMVVFVSLFLLTDPIKPTVVPQYYEELVTLIGEDMDTVCKELDITKEQLGHDIQSGVCQTTLKANYLDEEFSLILYFGRDNDLLSGFRYYTVYEGITEENAESAAKVARQLWKNYGKGFQWELKDDPKQLKNITGEALYTIFQTVYEHTGEYRVTDFWNLTGDAPDNVKRFLKQVEISEQWQKLYGEKAKLYEVSPRYYLTFAAVPDKETETIYINLEYKTGWIPGRYSVMVTGD